MYVMCCTGMNGTLLRRLYPLCVRLGEIFIADRTVIGSRYSWTLWKTIYYNPHSCILPLPQEFSSQFSSCSNHLLQIYSL